MSYIFYSSVTNPFDHTEKMLVWAKVNCPSYIKNDVVEKSRDNWHHRFYFGNEKDYLLFVLRWS